VPIHFKALQNFTKIELLGLIERAIELKKERKTGIIDRQLAGKTVGLFLEKPSTRTRVSFESAIYALGGQVVFLSSRDIKWTRSEPLKDISRVMSRYIDAMVVGISGQNELDELADYASIPVINAFTDLHHPCRILSDVMTIIEKKGSIENIHIGWMGNGNNMANSWIQAAAKIGFELTLACPEGHEPNDEILNAGQSEATRPITLVRAPEGAICSADIICVGVWASMEQFSTCRLDSALLDKAPADSIVLHCLPSYRGKEMAEEVLESERCAVFDQAENRMHIQKAILESFII
jgi:ornithine carbamoyltransferase